MCRRIVSALFVGLIIQFANAQAPSNAQPAANDTVSAEPSPFEQARALAAKGRLDKAMALLDLLGAQNPEPAGVERLRGSILYQKEEYPEATQAFIKAAEQDPSDLESIEMRGVLLFSQGHPAEAIPFLEKAHIAVERSNIDPQYVLGLCYTSVGRYDDARHAFASQYGFEPDSAEAHLLAARLFLRREFPVEAVNEAKKALEINPNLPFAHQLLGEAALIKADTDGAIHELEAERKINPLNGVLYDRLGDAYLRSGQYQEAQQALNRAVLLEPSSTAPFILLGETFLQLKQPIQALHYLDHASKMDPANYLTHNLLGQAYRATGQMEEAKHEFQIVVDLQHYGQPGLTGK